MTTPIAATITVPAVAIGYTQPKSWRPAIGYGLLIAAGLIAPFIVYPTFLMKVLCFALFACAFNLLLGFAGLLSFGHAAFFGAAAYVCAGLSKSYGVSPELRSSPVAWWRRPLAGCSAPCRSGAPAST